MRSNDSGPLIAFVSFATIVVFCATSLLMALILIGDRNEIRKVGASQSMQQQPKTEVME